MDDYGVNVGKVIFVGLLSVILTADAIAGLQALYYWQLAQVETSDDLYASAADLEKETAAQRKRLTDYWVVDPNKHIIAIPVSRAMELVTAELSARQDSRG
jgi:hypothetical protein